MKRHSIESLELRNLYFSYRHDDYVFKDFNFNLPESGVIYVQGPKGSGKNTFLKILLGLRRPMKGDFLINGKRANDFSHQEFDLFRLSMGYAFDVGGLINNQTLYENFRFILDYHDHLEYSERFDYIVDLLKVFNLDDKKHLRPSAISPSDRKAAVLLRSLILRPQLLILDNPTQGLSPEHLPKFIEVLSRHEQNYGLKQMIISSEDRNLLEQLSGKIFKVAMSGLDEVVRPRRMIA